MPYLPGRCRKITKVSLAKFIPPSCAEIKLRAERRAGEILIRQLPVCTQTEEGVLHPNLSVLSR